MSNALKNFRKTSLASFLGESALYAGIIYALINWYHYIPYRVAKDVEKWILVQESTSEPGFYLNNRHLPLKDIKPGRLSEPIPYDLIKKPNKELNFFVSAKQMELHIYAYAGKQEDGQEKWNLEATLLPGKENEVDKAGFSIQGALSEKYLVRIVREDDGKKVEYYLQITGKK